MRDHYSEIVDLAKKLQKDFKGLKDFEALTIAAQMRTVEVISEGLGTHDGDKAPLEAIAMVLGYKGKLHTTIVEELELLVQNRYDNLQSKKK